MSATDAYGTGAPQTIAVWRSLIVLFGLSAASAIGAIPLVDVASDASDPSNLSDTEPSIAVNPVNPNDIVVVSFSEGWNATLAAPIWRSTNEGTTWAKSRLIPQPSTGLYGPGDQKVTFDAMGNLLVAELGQSTTGIGDFVYRQTAPPPANLAAGAQYGNDQPHLDVDRTSGGACSNRVYSPWLDTTQSRAHSMTSDSSDTGITLTDEVTGDNSTFPNRTTRIALAPDGKAYAVYKTREGAVGSDFELAHFRVARSDDCGVTWASLGAGGVSVHGPNAVTTWFTNSFGNAAKGLVNRARSSDAWIAVNPISGTVYVAFVNKDASGFAQIYVAGSIDQGQTWTVSRATDGTHNCAFPEIAVNDSDRVAVMYIDYDDSGAKTLFRHHLTVLSAGASPRVDELLQSMDPGVLSNANPGFIWGDYEGLAAAGNTFYGVFTGQSIGRTPLQLDPIFFKASYFYIKRIRLEWLLDPSRLKVPVPWPCLQCPPFSRVNIYVDGDPTLWSVRLQGRAATPIEQHQQRTRTGVSISFKPTNENLKSVRLQFKPSTKAKALKSSSVAVHVETVTAKASPTAVGGITH